VAKRLEQTASPQRNFTLTTEERVGALVTGPPAWARRRKRIEELSTQIVDDERAGEKRQAKKKLAELVKLVEAHNAYYPIEANLPLDPDTSQLMEMGEPWKPMPRPTIESLLEAAAERERGPSTLAWSDEADSLSVAFDDAAGRRVMLRLDEDALSCRADDDALRVATDRIDEIVAARGLEVVTRDAETIRLPFRLEESLLGTIARELGVRLRAMRAAMSDYRGAT